MDGYLGEVKMFAGNYAPANWAFCDGRLLPISSYTALFSILGTQYGGDGRTTFGLPDLRSRVAMGTGQGPGLSPRHAGQKGGEERVILTSEQMPSHSHSVKCDTVSDQRSLKKTPADNLPGNNDESANYGANESGGNHMKSDMIEATGNNQPHDNMPPFLAINYIICLIGNYPPRD